MPVSTATNGSVNGHAKESIQDLKKAHTHLENADSQEGARYWGKRYVPNQGETFEVSLDVCPE
jgi:hypothetical protein